MAYGFTLRQRQRTAQSLLRLPRSGAANTVPPEPPMEFASLAMYLPAWNGPFAMTAREFVRASQQRLFRADEALLSMNGTDFTILCVLKITAKPANVVMLVGKRNLVGLDPIAEYRLLWNNVNDRFEFRVTNSANTLTTLIVAATPAPPAIGTTYHIRCGFRTATGTVFISVNDAAESTALHTILGAPQDVNDGTNDFEVGGSSATDLWSDSVISQVRLLKRDLTAGEATAVYNSGAGVREEQLPATIRDDSNTVYVASWPLDEESGSARDLRNGLTLTATNAPVGVHGHVETFPLPGMRIARWYTQVAPFVVAKQDTHGEKPLFVDVLENGRVRAYVEGDKASCTELVIDDTQGTTAQPFEFIAATAFDGSGKWQGVTDSIDRSVPRAAFLAGGGCDAVGARVYDAAGLRRHFGAITDAIRNTTDALYAVALWVKPTGYNNDFITSQHLDATATYDWNFQHSGTTSANSAYNFNMGPDVGTGTSAATPAGTPVAGAWAFLLGWYDPVADTVNLRVNDGAIYSTAAGGAFPNVSDKLTIGGSLAAAGNHFNGSISKMAVFRPTAASFIPEMSCALYNFGAGLKRGAYSAQQVTDWNPVATYDLDEASAASAANDSTGSLDIPAVNDPGVGSGPEEGMDDTKIGFSASATLCGNTALSTLTVPQATPHVWNAVFDGANSVMRKNGVSVGVAGNPGTTGVDLGKFAIMRFDGRQSALGIFAPLLTGGQRNGTTNWLKNLHNNTEGGATSFPDPALMGTLLYRITPDLPANVFTDTGGTTEVTADGDAVARLNATVGGINFQQATATNRPLYRAGGPGGRSVLMADGVNDFLESSSQISLTGSFHIFIVLRTASLIAAQSIFSHDTLTKAHIGVSGGFLNMRVVAAGSISSADIAWGITDNEWGLLEVKRDGSNKVDAAFNGGAFTRLFADVAQVGTFALERIFNHTSADSWRGGLADALFFSGAPTRVSVLDLLNNMYELEL